MASNRKGKKKPVVTADVLSTDKSQAQSARQERREKAIETARINKQRKWLVIGILIVTFLAFGNSLRGDFVYDDELQIVKNPTIKTLSNIPVMFTQSVWQFMNPADREATGPYYRPLFNIALIINYQMFQLSVVGWHIFCVFIHLAVTFLIYLLARRWGLTQEVAAAAALLFGVHPVHSESVAWVAALPDPMAGVFLLGALLLYERHFYKAESKPLIYGLSLAAAFLALMCKEVSVVFPGFLIVRELLDRSQQNSIKDKVITTAKRVAPFFGVVAVYMIMRYSVLGFINQNEPTSVNIPLSHVLLTVPSILLSYLKMLVVPYPLAVMYGYTYVQSAADPRFWGSALAVIAILIGVVWMVRSSQPGLRSLAWMMVFLLPVLNLKAFRAYESLVHDRYLYLPSIGFCILAAMALDWIAERFAERQREAFFTATAIVALPLLLLTINQNTTWQSETAMTNQALKVTPDWPFLHNYIGAYHFKQNQIVEAERAYNEALRINPNYFDSLSNLGDIHRTRGNLAEAERLYLKSIEAGAPYPTIYYNLGVVYTEQRRLADAERALQKAVELEPAYPKALYNLGWVYDNQGRNAEAEQFYMQTLQQDPNYVEPRINLGIVLTKQQRYKEALDQLSYAQRLQPDHSVMLYALGDLYMKTDRYQDALNYFNRLVAREPRHRIVHTSLGLCYEKLGQIEQAKSHFQKAIEIAPQDPYTNLARERLAKL